MGCDVNHWSLAQAGKHGDNTRGLENSEFTAQLQHLEITMPSAVKTALVGRKRMWV